MSAKYTGILIVEGITCPDPSDMTPTDQDISDSNRNSNGVMITHVIRENVHKLECKWNLLHPEDYMVLRNAIKKKFGISVTYYVPENGGPETLTMYVGDRKTPIYSMVNGKPVYKSVAMNFIEM